ncbi:hypothetical protein BTVI_19687 [Pitangus sulphuratus]|nr:hypothetical protein BTVI_19687 [Pitangus sulphuratus]
MVYEEHLALAHKIPGMVSTLLQRFGDKQGVKLWWHLAAHHEKQNQEVLFAFLCKSADFGRDLGDGDDDDGGDGDDDDYDGDDGNENELICQP